jgi:SAM-dependent methyltransferase
MVDPGFAEEKAALLGRFGSVFALNVVEHIEDDVRALSNASQLLRPGGRLIILVPAYPWLYNRFDLELCHYRRYTRPGLEKLFRRVDLEVTASFSFNLAGLFGWFFSGTLLRKRMLSQGQLTLYNRLVPLWRLADQLTFHRFGLSVITVGHKAEVGTLRVAA